MVLSHDCPCFIDYFTEQQRAESMPVWEYTHLHDRVMPALRERGVTDADLRTMLVDNPQRIFTATSSY
jgi:phosphotriesterase-related protein